MSQTDKAEEMSRNKQSIITATDYNLERIKTLTAGQIGKGKHLDSRTSSLDESLLRKSPSPDTKSKLKKTIGSGR